MWTVLMRIAWSLRTATQELCESLSHLRPRSVILHWQLEVPDLRVC